MDDLLNEFLTETGEALAVLDQELVKFEQDPTDTEILGNIFRLVHTIKGTCGFLGLPRLESVAHAGENVLGKFRDGVIDVTPAAVTLILKCLDCIRDLLGQLEESGEEPEGEDKDLIAELNAMADGDSAPVPAAAAPAPEAPAATDGEVSAQTNDFGAPVAQELLDEVQAATGSPPTNDFGAPVAQDLLDEVLAAEGQGIKAASQAQLDAEMEAERAAEAEKAAPVEVAQVPATAKEKAPAKQESKSPKESSVAASSIRVNVDVLEDLMTQVSELVLTRNQLLQVGRGLKQDDELTAPLQRLSHITSDLQEGVMKTRMQPIGNAWAKLPRIVRDLSLEQDKQIELIMVGAETELDRQILELIKDPLTHMVRNSADHGLEMPAERVEAGKPEKGIIELRAFHEGGHIIIEIQDDGRGLNMDRIRVKCLENGVATDAELENMTDQQIQQFIFAAGFSTAEKVTSISGRGVGMDVVRTNIEKIGGHIELKSVTGKGSTFTIKIPLTLAIVSALIVACAKQRFAIPQISVLELVRASTKSDNAIEMINDSPVLRLRNRLLPLVSLETLLELKKEEVPALPEPALAIGASEQALEEGESQGELVSENAETEDAGTGKATAEDEMFIVVTQVGTNTFGIIVDQVFDTEEIVVKPVAPILRNISFYSDNTILGEGSVIMILDPNGIANASGQMGGEEEPETQAKAMGQEGDVTSLLIFRAGGTDLKAVPLALIARLEEIDMATSETSHGQVMVQYRGHLMPLIACDPAHEFKTEGRQPVLVFTEGNRSLGLAVDEIVDIVEERLKIELASDLPGLVGSAVIDGKATDLIDAGHFLTLGFSDWFGSSTKDAFRGSDGVKRALLVDDSPFFRNLLSPLLSVAGWEVTTAETAGEALEMRELGNKFDVIISDIEMPEMDGFEFAQNVRGDNRWKDVPMIALSGRTSNSDFQRGRDAGFNDYVAKSDREALVGGLAQTVATVMQDEQEAAGSK
ncbi:MAG: chemotaxis protein CheW [Rhodospirillales bacterium]|nr:chemotaxis protein CheW [Rhodospirillales bacterium]